MYRYFISLPQQRKENPKFDFHIMEEKDYQVSLSKIQPEEDCTFILDRVKICDVLSSREPGVYNNPEFRQAIRCVKRMHRLKKALLCFEGLSGNKKSYRDLSDALAKTVNLRNLLLNISESHEIEDQHIRTIFRRQKRMKNLQKLGTNFLGCHIGGLGISAMLNQNRRINLEKFIVRIGGYAYQQSYTNNTGLINSSNSLCKLKNLKYFCLTLMWYINFCEMVNDKGFVKLSQNLSYLTQLEHLTLQIIKLGLITNESLVGISSTLSSALPKLIKLDLIFKECIRFTADGLESLMASIRFKDKLEKILLDFQASFLQNFNLLELSKSFSMLQNMKSLSLSIEKCESIDDTGISYVCNSLKELRNLSELTLNLRECVLITNKTVDHIINFLSESQIVSLEINLQWCNAISKEHLLNLESKIKESSTIKSLKLYHPSDVIIIK